MAKFIILAAIALFVSQALAVPTAEERQVVYHCANGVDNCPGPQWTCCGPILADVGGTCIKLKKDEVCAF